MVDGVELHVGEVQPFGDPSSESGVPRPGVSDD
jgi:hypothetical protein